MTPRLRGVDNPGTLETTPPSQQRLGQILARDLVITAEILEERLIALAEPCIILVMGLVVGFIVVAMLMAILSVTDIPL